MATFRMGILPGTSPEGVIPGTMATRKKLTTPHVPASIPPFAMLTNVIVGLTSAQNKALRRALLALERGENQHVELREVIGLTGAQMPNSGVLFLSQEQLERQRMEAKGRMPKG